MNAVIDQYDFWRRRLKGEVIPIIETEPQAGFYRDGDDAVAFWFASDGKVRCKIGKGPTTHSIERWIYSSKRPVTHEDYTAKIETGEWPSESKAVTNDIAIARTDPNANTFAGLQRRIALLLAEAEERVKAGGADAKNVSDAASDVADRLSKLWKQSEGLRTVEKQPHLDACRDVDDKWRPLLSAAVFYKTVKTVVCEPWLKLQKIAHDKVVAEARAKADEARRAAQEVADKAIEAAQNSNAPNELISQAAAEAQVAAEAAMANAQRVERLTVTAGTRGRSTGLRKHTVVIIEDREKVLAFFKDREEITEVLQTMANKAVKAGIAVPGTKVDKEEKAA